MIFKVPVSLVMSSLLLLGGVLVLGGCAASSSDWPNLASVPSREQAFPKETPNVPTESHPEKEKGPPVSFEDRLLAQKAALGKWQQDLTKAQAEFKVQTAAYEDALLKLTSDAAASNIQGHWNTAQLYLSRVIRVRDRMRQTQDDLTVGQRDLLDLNLASKGAGPAFRERLAAFSGQLIESKKTFDQAIGTASQYIEREMNRLAVLSAPDAGMADILSFSTGAADPVLTVRFRDKLIDYHKSLSDVVGMVKDRDLDVRYAVLAVGSKAALANKNALLLQVMRGLLQDGVALDRIILGVRKDEGTAPVEVRLYVQSL